MSTESGSVESEREAPAAPEAVESMSNFGDSIRSFVDDLAEHASVRSVYGDPIEADGRTIIPVARVAYGFGGGFGQGEDVGESGAPGGADGGSGEGAGVGGGVSAKPVGIVEVGDGETRFVRFGDRRRAGVAMVAGIVLGLLLGRRRYRS